MYQVGLGDSPMSIAGYLSGNPYRVRELLAANPHKPIVMRGGQPTFAALGVGERLNVPLGFVGECLCRAFGTSNADQAFAKMAQSFGTGAPDQAFAKLAHSFGVHGDGDDGGDGGDPSLEHHFQREGWAPGGIRITGMTGVDGIYMTGLGCAIGLGDVGLADLFGDIGHAVSSAVNDVGKAAGQAVNAVANVAKNAAHEAQKAVASVGDFVKKAGGDVGKFVSGAVNDFLKDPMGSLAKIATGGPLGILMDPDKLLRSLGIPGPSDILHKLGLPSPTELLQKVGIPTDPAFIVQHIFEPGKLLEKIPGIGEIAKYIPNAPNPIQMATSIISAAASGDLNKLKTAVIDVGHTVAGIVSMIPGVGNVIGGPLDAALTLLETGSPLKAALDLMLGEVPGIPGEIRDVFLRPAINGVADIIEHHESVTDALVNGIKDGIMSEAVHRGIPDALRNIIGNFLDGAIQLIFHHKPIAQVAAGFVERGIKSAISAVAGQIHLPDAITNTVDSLKHTFDTAKDAALKQFGSLEKIPGEVMSHISAAEGQYKGALSNLLGKLPTNLAGQISGSLAAHADVLGIGQKLNDIHALTQGIIKLNQSDPHKTNPTVQKQIQDIKASIQARKMGIQAHNKSLDANLGKPPPAHLAPAAKKVAIDLRRAITATAPQPVSPTAMHVPAAPTPHAPHPGHGHWKPYPPHIARPVPVSPVAPPAAHGLPPPPHPPAPAPPVHITPPAH